MQLDLAQIIDETKNHESYEQYFHLLLFITLHKVVQSFSLWMKPQCVTIQMIAIEQYFHVVLFIVL